MHGKLASGFTNMALYFWTDYELRLTQFSATKKLQFIGNKAKKGFLRNIFANTLLHNYNPTVELQFRFPSHTLLTGEGILILFSLAEKLHSKKVKNADYIMTYSAASFDATQKMWWSLVSWAESFPTKYSMNDFATKFFSRYYTLSYCELRTQYVQRPMKNFILPITLDDIYNRKLSI